MSIRRQAALLLLLAGVLALRITSAQETDDDVQQSSLPPTVETAIEDAVEQSTEDEGPVEEVNVVAPRPGARRDVPIEFDDPERARLLLELYSSREDQAELERLARIADEQDSRIRLGYNPDLDRPPGLDEQIETMQGRSRLAGQASPRG